MYLPAAVLEVSFTERRYTGVEGTTVSVRLEASGMFVQPFKARIFSSSFPRGHRLKDCEADEGGYGVFTSKNCSQSSVSCVDLSRYISQNLCRMMCFM